MIKGGRAGLAGFFLAPWDVALDANGNIWVADRGPVNTTGWLVKLDGTTGQQMLVSSDGSFVNPHHLAIAPDGSVIVVDSGLASSGADSGSVVRIDPITGIHTLISTGNLINAPDGAAIDAAGNLIMADTARVLSMDLGDSSGARDLQTTT